MSLKKLALTLALALVLSATLFVPGVGSQVQPPPGSLVPLKNWSFEYIVNSVRECQYWWTERGYRERMGDCDHDGYVGPVDLPRFAAAYGKKLNETGWNPDCDLDGDGDVDDNDLFIFQFCSGFATRRDGAHSWCTDTSADSAFTMIQQLDSGIIEAIKGQEVMFSFWFYPASLAPARASISYQYDSSAETVDGVWIYPTETPPPKWWNASVVAIIPPTAYAVNVTIFGYGTAYIDSASLRIWVLGDMDTDGYVGPVDLNMFAAVYGKHGGDDSYNRLADLDGDSYIGPIDLNIFAANYGKHI